MSTAEPNKTTLPETDGFPMPTSNKIKSNVVTLGGDDVDIVRATSVRPAPQPTMAAVRTCPQGHPVNDPAARFCTSCGQPVASVEAPAATPATAAVNRSATTVSNNNPIPTPAQCDVCQNGHQLSHQRPFCSKCRRLHPVMPGYQVEPALFQWAQDGQAMAKLRSMPTLSSIAKKVSDQVGRRWIETTFNGVRLSERQMPKLFLPAIHAARLLGLKSLPDIYVSGERPWDSLTFGSDHNAFLVMGSALVSSFKGAELGFLFAREFGHILAGHALWKTVIRFLVGEHNPKAGLMRSGVVGLLDPGKWIEGAIEVPLLNWARQAEITADRAGLLALGDQHIVRRVLLSWSLKSPFLYRHVNVEAWLEQQQEDALDEGIRMAEMMTSSTPHISRRLKLLTDYDNSEEMAFARQHFPHLQRTRPSGEANPTAKASDRVAPESSNSFGGFQCPACQSVIQVPAEVAETSVLKIRCPNLDCGQVHTIRRRARSESRGATERTNLQSAD